MRILVTGASGYLGSTLVRMLALRHDVVGVGRHEMPRMPDLPPLSWQVADLQDASSCRHVVTGADVVIHLAGLKGAGPCARDPWAAIRANVIVTRNLLEVSTAAHAGRFVFVSSYWVYGRQSPHELPCSEDAELRPIEPYGATKALAEMLVRASGLPCSIVRLTNVFGAGQGGDSREIVSAMAESARDSSVVCVAGDGHETLDLVGLDEACAAIAQLATNSARLSATVNLGSGQAMSVSEVATLVAETAAHELARPVNVEHRAASPGIRFSKAVSVDRLRSLVGYPRQDARAAIRQFVARLVARTG